MPEEKQFISSRDQLQNQLEQVIFDLEELLRSAGYDEVDEIGPNLPMFENLLKGVKNMQESLADGSLALGSGRDMPWVEVLDRPNMRYILPAFFELKQINLAQKNGVSE